MHKLDISKKFFFYQESNEPVLHIDSGETVEFSSEDCFQNEPQRCKACRDARKNAARGPREYFTAVCAKCGGEAKVPFEPKSDRPVYCSACFAEMRENG